MRGFSAFLEARRTTRMIIAGVSALLLLAVTGGTAWAIGTASKGRSVQVAGTYYITAQPGGTGTTVTWPSVGSVGMSSLCNADWNPGTGEFSTGGKALIVRNYGRTPVAVAFAPDSGFKWLGPGQEDAFILVGQAVNNQTPEPKAGVDTIAILAQNGASASGTFAWSASWRPGDHTGHCTFTLQLRG